MVLADNGPVSGIISFGVLAIAATALRFIFFLSTRRYRVKWWAAFLGEFVALGIVFVLCGQTHQLALAAIAIAISAMFSATITTLHGWKTVVALVLVFVQVFFTYLLIAVSASDALPPGECMWPGHYRTGAQMCEYI